MSDEEKEVCTFMAAKICKNFTTWEAPTSALGGVDGNQLEEHYLIPDSKPPDFSSKALLVRCIDLRTDCSTLVFYHCDPGPGNVFWDRKWRSVSIIDWGTA